MCHKNTAEHGHFTQQQSKPKKLTVEQEYSRNWNQFAFKQEVMEEYKARKGNEKHNVATTESAFNYT